MSLAEIPSLSEKLENLSPDSREELLRRLKAREASKPFYCMNRMCDGHPHQGFDYQHARADQWPPPGTDWFVFALLGGRGSGKTRAGAEYILEASKKMRRIGIIGPTGPSIRDTVVEGDSGLEASAAKRGWEVKYEPSKRRITFPSGCIASLFSAEEPDRLRGPQFELLWMDEPAHWEKVEDVWDMALLGLRLGRRPHIVITTTPLPTKWMKTLVADKDTRVARVSTYANLANLAPTVSKTILARYEGTRLGKQELHGEILGDVDGALWNMELIQYGSEDVEDMQRIVVGVDPAGSVKRRSDETGIVVVGKIGEMSYVLEDATGKMSPEKWASKVDQLVEKWSADAVVVERNYGGDMVKHTLRSISSKARIIEVNATRGKRVRAEPVVSKYEQGKVVHATGLGDLEEEMVTWIPDSNQPSPNRVDALVWAITDLQKVGSKISIGSARGKRLR